MSSPSGELMLDLLGGYALDAPFYWQRTGPDTIVLKWELLHDHADVVDHELPHTAITTTITVKHEWPTDTSR